jgi:hypothetical protein
MLWYVQLMGEKIGPLADAELVQMVSAGKVLQDTLVSQNGDGPWVTADHVRGLFAPRSAPAEPTAPVVSQEPPIPVGGDATLARDGESSDGPYKVITQRDPGFAGKFDPDKLEAVVNRYAASGWKVCGVATTNFTTLAGKREEVIVLMELHDGR